ncbi:flagellar hook-basal body complex protein FliE [Halanaerobaculum tunisiense]
MQVDKLANSNLTELNKQLTDDTKKNNASFKKILQDSLQQVNHLQQQSNQASQDLALGKTENIHQVMIASQKAKTSLDLTTAVRNKAVDAYKEIMRMRV